MSERYYVFAGGGTGGHLYPGLATARAVRELDREARIVFMTTDRALDAQLLGPTDYEQIEQQVKPATMHPVRALGFLRSWFASVGAAKSALRELRPRAVLGLGGYAAGPPVAAARKLGIRTALLNPDAIPGRANRFLAKKADRVFLQWEASRRHFPAGTECEVVGCPIRREFVEVDRSAGCAHFGLDERRPVLLVTGASQGARTINRAMQVVWPKFSRKHPDWQLLHLTGQADEAETRSAYESAGVSGAYVAAFTHEMWLAIGAADAVVCRAGASTLAELSAAGRPGILLPYPYARDRHQHANAAVVVEAGGAIVLEDLMEAEGNSRQILRALEELGDTGRRVGMSERVRETGRRDAAECVAGWMSGSGCA